MPHIDLGIAVGLTGAVVGLLLAVPFMIMEWPKDPKAIVPMLIFAPLMGLLIAVVGDYLIQTV